MTKSMPLGFKIVLYGLLIGLISISMQMTTSYYLARKNIINCRIDQLTSLRETKKRQIERYIHEIRVTCSTSAQNLMTLEAFNAFDKAFKDLPQNPLFKKELSSIKGEVKKYYEQSFLPKLNENLEKPKTVDYFFDRLSEAGTIAQYLYIVKNPNPVGKKLLLDKAESTDEYTKFHGVYHPIFRSFIEQYGFYDLFLVDLEGTVVYTVDKEIDFASNLLTGPEQNTNIGHLYADVLKATTKDFVQMSDFEAYDPSYTAPAAFMAAPIFDRDKKIAVLIFQMPIDEINRIMTDDKKWEDVGFGKTGETYLVGQDHMMRSISRFILENPSGFFETLESKGVAHPIIDKMRLFGTTILLQEVNTDATRAALGGESNTKIIKDYRGIPVLSSYTLLDIPDVKWAILSEIDTTEVFAPVYRLFYTSLFISFLTLALIVLILLTMLHVIVRPLDKLITNLRHIVKGNINLKETIVEDNYEQAQSLGIFLTQLLQRLRKIVQRIQQSKKKIEKVNADVDKIIREKQTEKQQIAQYLHGLQQKLSELPELTSDTRQYFDFGIDFFATIDRLTAEISTLAQHLQQNEQKNSEISMFAHKIDLYAQELRQTSFAQKEKFLTLAQHLKNIHVTTQNAANSLNQLETLFSLPDKHKDIILLLQDQLHEIEQQIAEIIQQFEW